MSENAPGPTPNPILPAANAAAIEMFGETFCLEFAQALDKLLQQAEQTGRGEALDFYKYCFAGNGKELWEDAVAWGKQSTFNLPTNEAVLLRRTREIITHLFAPLTPLGITIAPESPWDILYKEEAVHRAAKTSQAIVWGRDKRNAEDGAALLKMRLGVPVEPIVGELAEGLPVGARPSNRASKTSLVTMFGGAWARFFPGGKPPIQDIFNGIGQATGHNGFIIVTLDDNKDGRNEEGCYSGQHFKVWQENIWNLAKFVSGDNAFNPSAIDYYPKYDGSIAGTKYVHFVNEDTSLCPWPGMKRRVLAHPQYLTIGLHHNWHAKDITNDCHKSGWDQFLIFRNGGTTHAAVYVGKKTPVQVKRQVQKALGEIQGHDWVRWSGSVTRPDVKLMPRM